MQCTGAEPATRPAPPLGARFDFMNSSPGPTAHKLGANRTDPAHKSRRARNPSESRDIHEDRSTMQAKFARVEGATPHARTRPRVSFARPRGTAGPGFTPGPGLLPEHSSGPELHLARFRLFQEGARHVFVAGTFNDWNPERTPLQPSGTGEWEAALSLAPGDYEYRFVVDGRWVDDPLACRHAANPFGGVNAVLHVHRDEKGFTHASP